jgi:hypothetical protein
MPARIMVLANKTWEVDPLVEVFRNPEARPPIFPASDTPRKITVKRNDATTKEVQARLSLKSGTGSMLEVWCVRDLMDSPPKSSSSSEEKARVLKFLADADPKPSLIVAFGTAATAGTHSNNGCVVVGSSVFVFDAHPSGGNQESQWTHPDIGRLQDLSGQAVNAPLFNPKDGVLAVAQRSAIEARFLGPPIHAATPPTMIISPAHVALSNVNITDANDYAWADPAGLCAFAAAQPTQTAGSIETTHGVIRLMVPSQQFLFVSGIANRMGYFNMETAPRPYAQNFAASHNAAIALAWMIPVLMS